ncbi:putative quinol monooxygenase [Chelativorans sp. J32]|uniref:putative quinol monooxygenase n=1 Tax=Chelativorans sp. J32 TaxID=935840 RepID=UPI000485F957|nr:antibiotic biosynthesis monooxygenase family protein [Chelativorans sp. J32]
MFGLIGKMRAQPGMRDSLLEILTSSTGGMPGCLSYVIAKAEDDEDVIWITEVWDTEENHKASLSLPQVQQAISKARPLIAGFESHVRTAPIGGVGLPR